MNEVFIVDYLRSPFSRSRPTKPETDVFNNLTMGEVLGNLIKKIVERTKIDPEQIGDVITGCSMQMKENYMLGGRAVVFTADLPVSVPGQGTDRVCCSGMSALHQGAMEIMLGYSDIVIAGGMEHMTHLPLQFDMNPHIGITPAAMKPERLERYDLMNAMSMGLTAEKLFAECAEEFGVTREDMDKWGVRSHNLAEKAIDEGFFKDEIMPVEAKQADGSMKVIDVDQAVRRGATLEATAQLKPAFKATGGVTAGNSSPLNAGATALMMMSEKKMKELGLEPMARIVSMGWAGVEPNVMGKGPVPASEKALKHAGLQVKDIDFWEINEAFAIVPIYAIKKMGLNPDSVNVKGGAVAIGHPLAASGPRLTGTLARIMKLEGAKYGSATLCGGGGQGATTIIERV
ncbi:MAG: acetyl-CoA C-acetyltransferase [bacterium]